jgi:hypothetical protein
VLPERVTRPAGQVTREPRPDEAGPPRRPWWVWTVPFAVVLAVLLVRNAFLFFTPEYENADMGAYSIEIEQARRFALLVGNYSREHFSHPGPAYLYVQSWGESLFWAWLHVVPTAWNGQLIALYALNAAFAALVVAVGYGWTRSARGAAAAFAVAALYGALHPSVFSSDWMPYVYVPAYFVFVVAIASVAAGGVRDTWIAALAGWFLIHGHACFLFLVPVLSLAALAVLLWPRLRSARPFGLGRPRTPQPRNPPGAPSGPGARWRWRTWLPAGVISAVFALPVVAELALHWPGNFGKYFSYSSSAQSGGHGAAQVADYVLWFWWPRAGAWAAPVLLYAVAGLLTWRLPAGPVRRFCVLLLAFDALSTAAFAVYAAVGIDTLSQHYIGYFYWSAPVIVVLAGVLATLEALPSGAAGSALGTRGSALRTRIVPSWTGLGIAAVAAVAACAAFAMAPQTRTSTDHADPANPAVTGPTVDPAMAAGVARMAALAAGRPIVLRFTHDAWPAMTGVLVQAQRSGVRACVADPNWTFMVTSQFICAPAELADGRAFRLYPPGPAPRGVPVLVRLRRAIVTSTGR